jgi:hypothetical protein
MPQQRKFPKLQDDLDEFLVTFPFSMSYTPEIFDDIGIKLDIELASK